MKKFIMCCPLQPEGKLKKNIYEPDGDERLRYGETCFPVIPMINAYTSDGEEIELIVIKSDAETTEHNMELLNGELESFEKRLSIKKTMVPTSYNETIGTQLDLFAKLVSEIRDGDELYICDTFGTKPTPMIENMAAQYAAKAMENVTVESVVYGQLDHVSGKSKLFDITALLYMQNIADGLADLKLSDPAQRIRKILDM